MSSWIPFEKRRKNRGSRANRLRARKHGAPRGPRGTAPCGDATYSTTRAKHPRDGGTFSRNTRRRCAQSPIKVTALFLPPVQTLKVHPGKPTVCRQSLVWNHARVARGSIRCSGRSSRGGRARGSNHGPAARLRVRDHGLMLRARRTRSLQLNVGPRSTVARFASTRHKSAPVLAAASAAAVAAAASAAAVVAVVVAAVVVVVVVVVAAVEADAAAAIASERSS